MLLTTDQIASAVASSAILPKVATGDKTAVKNCIDKYGNLIWTLARKYTGSKKEAETATEEIFLDVWRYSEKFDRTQFDEGTFIFLVARRRLMKRVASDFDNL